MKYNNFALAQVGGLRIRYNRRGEIIGMFGSVKGYRSSYQYSNLNWNHNNYNSDYNQNYNNYDSDYNQNQNDGYYYKQDGTKSKIKNDENSGFEKKADSIKTKR